MQADKSK